MTIKEIFQMGGDVARELQSGQVKQIKLDKAGKRVFVGESLRTVTVSRDGSAFSVIIDETDKSPKVWAGILKDE